MPASRVDVEKRWTFGAWLTLAVVLAWMSTIFLALISLEQPSDGWSQLAENDGTFTFETNMAGGPSVLQVGDVLIGINGQMLSARYTPRFPPDLRPGQIMHYTIQRKIQRENEVLIEVHNLDVPLVRLGGAALTRIIAETWSATPRDYIVGTLSLLVVALAFVLRPGNLGARYLLLIFSFYCFQNWFGGAHSGLYVYSYPLSLFIWYSLTGPGVWAWYFFPSITLMALAFPVVKYPLRRFPRLLPAVLYGVPLSLTTVAAYAGITWHDRYVADLIIPVFLVIMVVTVLAIFGALIHNWLTVREPIARAQLRWLTLGLGAGFGLLFVIMLVSLVIYGELPRGGYDVLWLPILLPISMAIAITRYRLFDIDVIIRRTLVYSVLTALLALAFLGSVLVLQYVFQSLTGQEQDQPVTVISTLGIAALFVPLRRRVQEFIDHRFFRRKYDAARILAQFAAGAREDLNLADLQSRLMGVVDATLQPESVDVWLRPAPPLVVERR
jgi:hypothetical protein